MGNREDIREFLTTRRARLTPEQAGLPNFGGRRRVPGLRREEVALLAGMSTEYYVRLERGNAGGVSESVLDGISRALQLDDAEHTHLYDLVRAANEGNHPSRRRKPARPERVRPALQQTIDAMRDVPVIVQNGRLDLIAANQLGVALFHPAVRLTPTPRQLRPLPLPRPPRAEPLPRLGGSGSADRGDASKRSRTRTVRPGAHRTRR